MINGKGVKHRQWAIVRLSGVCQGALKGPGTHAYFWDHNQNPVKIPEVFMQKIIHISGHKFAHVMTGELSWHVQIYDLIGPL